MTIALAAILWQLADAISYPGALARNAYGESNPAMALTSLQNAELAKVIGIAAVAVGLVVLRPFRRLHVGAAVIVGLVGAFGAATNMWGIVG